MGRGIEHGIRAHRSVPEAVPERPGGADRPGQRLRGGVRQPGDAARRDHRRHRGRRALRPAALLPRGRGLEGARGEPFGPRRGRSAAALVPLRVGGAEEPAPDADRPPDLARHGSAGASVRLRPRGRKRDARLGMVRDHHRPRRGPAPVVAGRRSARRRLGRRRLAGGRRRRSETRACASRRPRAAPPEAARPRRPSRRPLRVRRHPRQRRLPPGPEPLVQRERGRRHRRMHLASAGIRRPPSARRPRSGPRRRRRLRPPPQHPAPQPASAAQENSTRRSRSHGPRPRHPAHRAGPTPPTPPPHPVRSPRVSNPACSTFDLNRPGRYKLRPPPRATEARRRSCAFEPTASTTSPFAPRPKGSPTALAELLAAFRGRVRKVQARGLFGAARGYALARLVQDSKRPRVFVEADEEAADAPERDLRFFAGERAVVRIPAEEILPYQGLTPDRLVAQQRLAGLFRLHLGERPIVVCSIKSIGRRVLPRAALDRRSLQISVDMEQDRDELARMLTAAGYAKVPLVEDPGTYAIRGGVFDVWSPLDPQPVRLEFLGDLVEKIRSFDPQSQRTSSELKELSLCPAREIVLDEEGRRAAIATVRAAADAVETPSRQLRELVDDLTAASQDDALFAAGLTAILPGFYPGGLSPLTEYLPKDAIWVLDDPLELERQWGELWQALEDAFAEARKKGELALAPDQHFLHEREMRPALEAAPVLELSGLTIGAEAAVGTAEIDFDLQPTSDLRAEIHSHHGQDGEPLPPGTLLEWPAPRRGHR